jgi:glycine reductase complex component B subunit gamma
VGLVQRVLEASGISTVTLSWIPELTRAVGVPRLAGLSYPMSRPLGRPHDPNGQRAVLRATLEVLARASGPDSYVELPFEWPESPAQARNASRDLAPSPIVELLRKKPWLIARLYGGRVPLGEADSMR